ncbi:MAG TPA: hypothetical protein VF624_15705 [Tepidisphaeraceae bacterium]|jgi:hypothetical protein
MPTYAAQGKVTAVEAETIIFRPTGTVYALELVAPDGYAGPIDAPVQLVIKATARKAYTVPSGGLFVTPIVGTPRVVQGRVKHIADGTLTLNCGMMVTVSLPPESHAIDLARGEIAVGSLVNAVLQPGASYEVKA